MINYILLKNDNSYKSENIKRVWFKYIYMIEDLSNSKNKIIVNTVFKLLYVLNGYPKVILLMYNKKFNLCTVWQ